MVSFELPEGYGYVLLSAVSTFVVASVLSGRVGTFRKAANVPYPYEYASYEQVSTAPPAKAKQLDTFNRAQRAHQNFNENHTSALAAILIAGLKYPGLAAVLGAGWSVNRIVYGYGYTNGAKDGSGRYYGILWMVCHIGLIGAAGKAGWEISKVA